VSREEEEGFWSIPLSRAVWFWLIYVTTIGQAEQPSSIAQPGRHV
jgi:hypothetical protein